MLCTQYKNNKRKIKVQKMRRRAHVHRINKNNIIIIRIVNCIRKCERIYLQIKCTRYSWVCIHTQKVGKGVKVRNNPTR